MYGVRDVRVEDAPIPQPEDDQLLVRVKACGICPVDIRVYTGENVWVSLPAVGISGHEVAGVVESVGRKVFHLKPGDRVAGVFIKPCGVCKYCITGHDNLCSNIQLYRPRYFGFGEYIAAYPDKMMRYEADIEFEEAAFTEPLAACVNGIMKCRIRPGDYTGIVGVGQIGLMHVQLAKLRGARVVAFDMLDERLKMAEKLGADYVVNVSERDAVKYVEELTRGEGLDQVITAIGGRQAIETGLKTLGKTGTLNIFASTHPHSEISLDPNLIHYRELVITGSFSSTKQDIRTAIRLLERRAIDVRSLITHRLPLERIEEGFRIHTERKGLKVMILP
ncbi:D-arabitol-phosphate dehydrogenase [archaeon HR01]|nr:D-arabitol-phosphate dehydrogenase [archaeon HR01]